MTDPQPAGGMPAPDTAPARIDSGQPDQQAQPAEQQPAPAANGGEQETDGLTAEEEAQLGELLAKRDAAAAAAGGVRMKVEGDHQSLSYGGLTVGSEFTDVPASMVGPMTTAAAESGVQLTQET